MALSEGKLVVFLLLIYVDVSLGTTCGYPGSPVFGRPQPSREIYRPGEIVYYTCTLGYSLQGTASRQCHENGTWSGTMPICDTSLSSMNHYASSRATLLSYTADKAIDGDRNSCTYTEKKKPRWVRVDLRNPYRIQAVAVTVPRNTHMTAQFTIYVISVQDSSTASYHKCAYFNGKFSTETVKLPCAGGSIVGQYVHVEDNRNDIDYFSICEVDVFVKRDSYDCGEVERPSQSIIVTPRSGFVEYRCIYGYRLMGSPMRQCLPNGQWSDQQPVCQEVLCPTLPDITHGRTHYVGIRQGRLSLGTSANFSCDYGYQLTGIASLICLESGQWSEGYASCQPINCEVPSIRSKQERYVLLNHTTTYGSMALLYCGDDHDPDVISVIRTCREDGTWSTVNLDCSENNILSTLELVDEPENVVPTGVIIGLVLVVFLLIVTVVFILLVRRRNMMHGNSCHSLPSKDTSSSLVDGSSCGKQVLYENDAFYASIPVENGTSKPTGGNETTDNVVSNTKFSFSTILFSKKKRLCNNNALEAKRQGSSASSTGICVYEEIGKKPNCRKKNLDNVSTVFEKQHSGESDTMPVYAQVDYDEKRRSRLVKSLCDKIDCDIPITGDGMYHSVEAPTFEELDSEPIKLRELPPIPSCDDESICTYASLSNPLEPPELNSIYMRQNDIYGCASSSNEAAYKGDCVMKDNDLYLSR